MARRQFNVFNLSFLDVMSCGLGAVVLFFMVINAQVSSRAGKANQALQAEADRLEEEVLEGRKNMVRIRNALETDRQELATTDGAADRIEDMLKTLIEELAEFENSTLAKEDSIEKLKSDIERLEAAKKRLAAKSASTSDETGQKIRSYVGDGNRQYLTGMQMGGQRILILVDSSASMLGRTYVNVIRFRNMRGRAEATRAEMAAGGAHGRLADHADSARHALPDLHLQPAGRERDRRHRGPVAGRYGRQ